MSAEEQGRLFDLFYTTRKTGPGLGLAVVHQLVEQFGGRIEVESILAGYAGDPVAAHRSGGGRMSTGHPLFLIVDDDRGHRTMLRAVLAEVGYQTLEADDGDTTVERAKMRAFDLVLLDL